MPDFYIVRLGADSESEIRKIDAFDDFNHQEFGIEFNCKQVPSELSPGDVAIIWLGTNNNKGGKTPWVQGIRALGTVKKVAGEAGYNASKTVSVSVGIVLPRSVTKMDIVTEQRNMYRAIAGMPVLGVNNYSSQVIQHIDESSPAQSVPSLLQLLDGIVPGFADAASARYPNLRDVFTKAIGYADKLPTQARQAERESFKVQPDNLGEEGLGDGLDPSETDELIIEVPFDPTKIDIAEKQMAISTLQSRLENRELDLTPDFQRQANIWDQKRKSRLIESILLRIPLPSFYFSEDHEGGYSVVDGLQRLCAIFHFKDAGLLNQQTGATLVPLRLKGLQYLKELEDQSFQELDRKFQRRISELEITANVIRTNTPSAVKFNVFARLNQGGLPLNAQEIRNAIFPGEWRAQIRELAESKEFLSATEGRVSTLRQLDMELVLRYIALWQLKPPYRRRSGQTLDEFLNTTVEEALLYWTSSQWSEAKTAFFTAIEAVKSVLGDQAFRRNLSGRRTPINRGLFEAEMIALGNLQHTTLQRLISRQDDFKSLLGTALRDDEAFSRVLLVATGSPEASNARLEWLSDLIDKAVHAPKD